MAIQLFNDRYSIKSLESNTVDNQGLIFATSRGFEDLSGVNIVLTSVDTIRQNFEGVPHQHIIDKIDALSNVSSPVFILPRFDGVGHYEFDLLRMGKKSGYRFALKNMDLGVIIMFGQYHGFYRADVTGSNLKVELSPHFINCRTSGQINDFLMHPLHGLAPYFLSGYSASGVSVHLAADYQGYELSNNFIDRFTTHARVVKTYTGVNTMEYQDYNEFAMTYGHSKQAQNYLIGQHKSTQLCLYNKDIEAVKNDKIDYFNDQWNVFSIGTYDSNQPVRRLEVRLHHSVIRELGLSAGLDWVSFLDVANNLNDLWRYGLTTNRLNCDPKNQEIAPIWQLLRDDVYFGLPSKPLKLMRQKKTSTDPINHNLAAVIGNMVSILARQGFGHEIIMLNLRNLYFYPEIIRYYWSRNKTEEDLIEFVKEGVKKRRMAGCMV